MTEEEQLARLKRIFPMIAAGLTLFAFVAVRMAGHAFGTAVLVGAIMMGFAMGLYLARVLFGVNGFLAFILAAFLLAWRLGRTGWLEGG